MVSNTCDSKSLMLALWHIMALSRACLLSTTGTNEDYHNSARNGHSPLSPVSFASAKCRCY
eukprot:1462-Heterococcus_DN1.PRE.3